MTSVAVSIDVVVEANSTDLALSCLDILQKYCGNAAKPDDKYRRINKSNDIYQRRIHCVSGSTEVLRSVGWVDGGDTWTLPASVTAEAATDATSAIQAKIEYLKAEQEKKVLAEREKQQAKIREEQQKKAELRGQYAGDKCARKEEGWKPQVSAAAMKDGKSIARLETNSCDGGCC